MAEIRVTGHELANYAYKWMVFQKLIPKAPKGKEYNWQFIAAPKDDKRQVTLRLFLQDKTPEPEKEPYKAGDWKEDD